MLLVVDHIVPVGGGGVGPRSRLLRKDAHRNADERQNEEEHRERCAHSAAVFEGYHGLLRQFHDVAEQKDGSGDDDAR